MLTRRLVPPESGLEDSRSLWQGRSQLFRLKCFHVYPKDKETNCDTATTYPTLHDSKNFVTRRQIRGTTRSEVSTNAVLRFTERSSDVSESFGWGFFKSCCASLFARLRCISLMTFAFADGGDVLVAPWLSSALAIMRRPKWEC